MKSRTMQSIGYRGTAFLVFTVFCIAILAVSNIRAQAAAPLDIKSGGQAYPFMTLTPTPAAGSRLIFTSDRDKSYGNYDLYLIGSNGLGVTRLTNSTWANMAGVFSPDGTHIALISNQTGADQIYLMNADGTGRTQLTTSPSGNKSSISWSPDGTKIVFCSALNSSGFYQIWVINADGTDEVALTSTANDNVSPAWSPDGTTIAFVSTRDWGRNYEIYRMNVDGTEPIRLTDNPTVDNSVAWSPDGTKLVFYSDRDGHHQIYTMNPDGTEQTRVTNTTSNEWNPVWSPDGTKFTFVSDRDGNPEIYLMNADGSDQLRLTEDAGNDQFPAWIPDNAIILPATLTPTPTPTSMPTLTPTPTATPSETVPPVGSVVINRGQVTGQGALYTASRNVMLTLSATDDASGVAHYQWSTDDVNYSDWLNYAPLVSTTLSADDGLKIVYVHFRDGAGNVSVTYSDTIMLDTSAADLGFTINYGAQWTNTEAVTLTIPADSGATEMRISNSSSFIGATWEPYALYKDWQLSIYLPHLVIPYPVYAQLRMASGSITSLQGQIIFDRNPPQGNLNVTSADANQIQLNLEASDDGQLAAMRVGLSTMFNQTEWEPYATTKTIVLGNTKTPTPGSALVIYAQFRDAAGNLSAPVCATTDSSACSPTPYSVYLPIIR